MAFLVLTLVLTLRLRVSLRVRPELPVRWTPVVVVLVPVWWAYVGGACVTHQGGAAFGVAAVRRWQAV